ncbi:MAG: GNAT family N-acetyltransferase [Fimbriimonas ginsengisoli]|uniref:GNAT family N-acetyltransferase n=1 Tax=Fimbriimonas ginsengisoli TaxID=1005039 RepID=A0A931LR56_FIMGI|nr:GNAT family N-acetyltransferase [Fimbriimonas ginsengisoli]
MTVLRRLERALIGSLARDRECIDCGPFRLLLNRSSDMIWSNYAVPTRDGFDLGSVRAMIEAFEAKRRRPRLEFTLELWPGLPPALVAAGFELEAEQPTMVCLAAGFQPRRSPEVSVELLAADGDVETFLRIADSPFGMPSQEIAAGRVQGTRDSIAKGVWVMAVGSIGGAAAGVGCINPFDGVCELAGIGTLDAFRRLGVASSVSTFLLEKFFADGGEIAWLSAGDDTAKAVYERLGFRAVATRVNYSGPG